MGEYHVPRNSNRCDGVPWNDGRNSGDDDDDEEEEGDGDGDGLQ